MKVFVCPKCGSGKLSDIQYLGTVKQDKKCLSCGWMGPSEEAPEADIPEPPGVSGDVAFKIAEAVSAEYMKQLHEHAATPIARSMVIASLVGGKEDKKLLARLIRAAVLGTHKATLEELELIQRESVHGRPS